MENNFKIISIKEENLLSIDEKKKYYEELKQYLKSRKLTNTTPCATTIAPKLKGITSKIAVGVTKAFTNKDIDWVCEGKKYIPNETAIFAHTHQGLLDNFIWIPQIKQHCLLLHGQEVNKLLLMCQLNTGLILVKKGDKENNNNAKLDMIRLLSEGHSITYFPEGTWNLSPNKLHLPLSYGFIDIARKTGVPIVPVAHEFTYDTSTEKEKITKIHTKFGKPIYVKPEDDLIEKLHEYEEAISTLKYELIESKGISKRADISNKDYINYLKGNYSNLKLGKLNLDKERVNIFGGKDEFYEFHHINDVPYDEEGKLLDTEEMLKVKTLIAKHIDR